MDHKSSASLQEFKSQVAIKFQLYNSLFTALPFHRIEKTGILLSVLQNNCEEGYKRNQSPVQIIEDFFTQHTAYFKEQERLDLLFRFVQFTERQVVLFDALEDAAFSQVNDMNGAGSLKQLESLVISSDTEKKLEDKLKDFSIRLVLTAHPTQFYPGPVLGIINDLSRALNANNASQVNMYLQQLGRTPFFNKQKPTPYDEAVSLIWYLENIFYHAAGRIAHFMKNEFGDAMPADHPILRMGFWPGGDRDGNPFVMADTTMQVAEALRTAIVRCYYTDVRRIKRRITFEGVETILGELEKKLYNNLFIPGQKTDISRHEMLDTLEQVRQTVIHKYNGLFVDLLENLISKIEVFGLHFASLDVRQDSNIHGKVYDALATVHGVLPKEYPAMSADEKIKAICGLKEISTDLKFEDAVQQDTIPSVRAIRDIQHFNGVEGCNRYIISQCNSALNVFEVYGLFLLAGWKKEEITVDIVPLFETVDDLHEAAAIMRSLYEHPEYLAHLRRRGMKQTIMLGFSDGTKDGGYLMANWSIYKAKEELTTISRDHGVDVVFFDGRGGPPARGGGKTHKFYASMGKNISNKEIQLTIQGQTVSSNFGTIDSAQFNIEQLLNAGITNDIFPRREAMMSREDEALINELAGYSFDCYLRLKNHPEFLEYLAHVSPVKFYAETNIGSRPSKRGGSSKLALKDLRAIPFVGAWSQLKQNVTGYYGVGYALQEIDKKGRLGEVKKLYQGSLFFKTLMDNCEMAMKKSFFPLTAFLAQHPVYGEIWNMIHEEYERTMKYIFQLSGRNELMSDYPVEQLSVQMRERIVLPLTTIQQYAITKVRELEEENANPASKAIFEKLVMRCSFGIINAGRNSA